MTHTLMAINFGAILCAWLPVIVTLTLTITITLTLTYFPVP